MSAHPKIQAIAARALAEGRLAYIVTDQRGCPANGGTGGPLPMPTAARPGAWQPVIGDAKICERGYHMTSEPHRWAGCRVFLGEGRGLAGRDDDKSCWTERRVLAEVWPHECLDASALVRCSADLRGADLQRADLPDGLVYTGPDHARKFGAII